MMILVFSSSSQPQRFCHSLSIKNSSQLTSYPFCPKATLKMRNRTEVVESLLYLISSPIFNRSRFPQTTSRLLLHHKLENLIEFEDQVLLPYSKFLSKDFLVIVFFFSLQWNKKCRRGSTFCSTLLCFLPVIIENVGRELLLAQT